MSLSISALSFIVLAVTVAVWLVADFEALSYQVTTTFDTSCAARIRTAPAINYTACYQLAFFVFYHFSINLLHRFCLPCVGVGKLFGWFWSCVGFFERPANVLDYEAWGSVKSIAKSSNEEIPFNSFVSIQSIPLPGV